MKRLFACWAAPKPAELVRTEAVYSLKGLKAAGKGITACSTRVSSSNGPLDADTLFLDDLLPSQTSSLPDDLISPSGCSEDDVLHSVRTSPSTSPEHVSPFYPSQLGIASAPSNFPPEWSLPCPPPSIRTCISSDNHQSPSCLGLTASEELIMGQAGIDYPLPSDHPRPFEDSMDLSCSASVTDTPDTPTTPRAAMAAAMLTAGLEPMQRSASETISVPAAGGFGAQGAATSAQHVLLRRGSQPLQRSRLSRCSAADAVSSSYAG